MVLLQLDKIKKISAEETWQLRHEVLWPEEPFDFVKLPEDSMGNHFGLFLEDELISVVSLFQTEKGIAQFRKFATQSKHQSKGYGTKLLLHLIQFVQVKGFHMLWCNARVDKAYFYKKFGMLETSKTCVKRNLKFVILRKVF